ncbi:hypothetical protein, partial [Burkholderia cenocepacia]|uniref:hypothetical protein n=1 Tax=Burkholderia cenocepacia TaxID=95486 RepID=UPI001C4E084D
MSKRKNCGLRPIDFSAQAEHDRQSEHRDREGRGLEQDVQHVAVELHAGGERHQRRGAQEIRQVPNDQRFRAHGRRRNHVVAGAHAFSATRSPKMPCGRNT